MLVSLYVRTVHFCTAFVSFVLSNCHHLVIMSPASKIFLKSRVYNPKNVCEGRMLVALVLSGEAKHSNWSCYANLRLSMPSNRIMLCKYKIIYNILISTKTYPKYCFDAISSHA